MLVWRRSQLSKFEVNPGLIASAKEYYRTHPVEFVLHWCDTYDPRLASQRKPTHFPFILFKRQREFIQFVYECLMREEAGLCEKSRDMGATWLCVSISVWLFLFWPGAAVGWGSRDQDLVDRIGDPDSIFEKIRILLRRLPPVFLPAGFSHDTHLNFMRCVNPENGAAITGEIGDDIGRGGRKLIYFKDEAQPLNAKILTPTGWQTMADMRPGSQVVGLDGLPCKVTQVKDCGVHDVYRLTFSDGTSAECSPNHLWTVDRVKNGKIVKRVTLRAHELAQDYFYQGGGNYKAYKYRVPVCAPVQFAPGADLPMDPYLIGALLGDGSVKGVKSNGGRTPGFTTADHELVDSFSTLLPQGCVIVKSGGKGPCYGYRIVDELRRACLWKGSRARALIMRAGIAGLGAADKYIPDVYKFAPPQARLSLLQGLLDTDGCSSSGCVHFCSGSKRLALDVRFLVQSLGGTATLNVKPAGRSPVTGKKYLDMYGVHIALPPGMVPFRLSRKIATLKERKHPLAKTIVSVEVLDRRPVRCISVDRSDGLYLTDDMIVTHNSAHYKHPELIEASLSDNTRVPIDISSVNGPANVFYRKREAGQEWFPGHSIEKGHVRVFVMDWRDHPGKTQGWYNQRRNKAEREGLLHVLAQEVDRDYFSALQGVIIDQIWVKECTDAHTKLGVPDEVAEAGEWGGGLDVADEGLDRNAIVTRKGIVMKEAEEWGSRDPGIAARKAVAIMRPHTPCALQYDSIGVGAAVKSETNRLREEDLLPKGLRLSPWNAGAAVLNPGDRVVPNDKESPRNKDFYHNLKAQAWWELRGRFFRTYVALINDGKFNPETGMVHARVEGAEVKYAVDELISVSSKIPILRQLQKELSQATSSQSTKMRMLVDKTPDGTASPNVADAAVMAYWPLPERKGHAEIGLPYVVGDKR